MSSFISASQPVRSASRPTAFRRLSWDGGEDEVFPVSGGSSTSSPSSQDSSVVVHSSSQETINKAKDSQLTPPKSGDENEIKLPATYELILTTIDGSTDKIKAIPLVEKKAVTLGRKSSTEPSTQADGAIECPVMSKKHAEVVLEYGEVYLSDVGSMHGTFVNGEKLSRARRRVKDGDRITFGKDVEKRGQVHPALKVLVSLIQINAHMSRPPSSSASSIASPVVASMSSVALSPTSSRVRSPLPGGRSPSPLQSDVALDQDESRPHPGLFQFTTADELGPDSPHDDGSSSPLNAPTSLADITERFSVLTEDAWDQPSIARSDSSAGGEKSNNVDPSDERASSPEDGYVAEAWSMGHVEEEETPAVASDQEPSTTSRPVERADSSWRSYALSRDGSYRGGVFDRLLNGPESPDGSQKGLTSDVDAFVQSRSISVASTAGRRGRRLLLPENVALPDSDDSIGVDDDDGAPSETEIDFGVRKRVIAKDDSSAIKLTIDDFDAVAERTLAHLAATIANDDNLGSNHAGSDESPVHMRSYPFLGSSLSINPVLKRRERLQKKLQSSLSGRHSSATQPAAAKAKGGQQTFHAIESSGSESESDIDDSETLTSRAISGALSRSAETKPAVKVKVSVPRGSPIVMFAQDASEDDMSDDDEPHEDEELVSSHSDSDDDDTLSQDAMDADDDSGPDNSAEAASEDDGEDEDDPIEMFSDDIGGGPTTGAGSAVIVDLLSNSDSDAESSHSDADSDDSVIAIEAPTTPARKHLPVLAYGDVKQAVVSAASAVGSSSSAAKIIVGKVEPVEGAVPALDVVPPIAVEEVKDVKPVAVVVAEELNAKLRGVSETVDGVNEKAHALDQRVQKVLECAEMLSSTLGKRKRVDVEEESLDDQPAVASSSTSTQTVPAPAQVQTSVQTSPSAPIAPVMDAPAPPAQEPPRKKARAYGAFFLGALAGSVATVSALAAYGWNEEMGEGGW